MLVVICLLFTVFYHKLEEILVSGITTVGKNKDKNVFPHGPSILIKGI